MRIWRLRTLAQRGVDAEADIVDVVPTRKATDGQPWVTLHLRVHQTGQAPADVRLTWLTRPFDMSRLVKGQRIGVKILPGRPHVVALRGRRFWGE